MKWEVKRDNKAPSPTLASEVRILVLETQSFALDQRVGQRSINDPPCISPAGGNSAGISIRSPLLREICRQMSCGLVAFWLQSHPDYSTGPQIVKSPIKWLVGPIVLSPTDELALSDIPAQRRQKLLVVPGFAQPFQQGLESTGYIHPSA